MAVPSVWKSNESKYNDYVMNECTDIFQVKYDKPKVQRNRDYILKKGAIFFQKGRGGWRLEGVIKAVDEHGDECVTLTIQKLSNTSVFSNKTEAVTALGFQPLSSYERIFGLIPLARV